MRGWTLDRGRDLTCLTPDWCDCVCVADLAAMTTTEISRCGKAASRLLSGLHSFSFFLSALSIYTFSRRSSYERELNAVMSAELQWCHCLPVISLIKLNKPFRSCLQRTVKQALVLKARLAIGEHLGFYNLVKDSFEKWFRFHL